MKLKKVCAFKSGKIQKCRWCENTLINRNLKDRNTFFFECKGKLRESERRGADKTNLINLGLKMIQYQLNLPWDYRSNQDYYKYKIKCKKFVDLISFFFEKKRNLFMLMIQSYEF